MPCAANVPDLFLREQQTRILPVFTRPLKNPALSYTGASESLTGLTDLYEAGPSGSPGIIYRKK